MTASRASNLILHSFTGNTIMNPMITEAEERYILDRAYIPEHSVGLMTRVSDGEPFLMEDCFCLRRGQWIIVVGYPLGKSFDLDSFEAFVGKIKEELKPQRLSLMAPALPPSLIRSSEECEEDVYYTLDIRNTSTGKGLQRVVKKAREHLTVERSVDFTGAHRELTGECIEGVGMHPRVRRLFLRMPHYVGSTRHSIILNAWDREGNLAAFYVVDLAPKDFATYVIGCHSKRNYRAGASDLLVAEMISLSRAEDKEYIHLGLGVNRGIVQFKKKWGGVPTIRYEMCELSVKRPSLLDAIRALSRAT